MKKVFSILFALLFAASLTACGGSSSSGAVSGAAGGSAPGTNDAEAAPPPTEGGADAAGPDYGTVEDQVVVDDADGGIKLTVTGMRTETVTSYDGAVTPYIILDFLVENTSAEDFSVQIADLAIDDCSLDYITDLIFVEEDGTIPQKENGTYMPDTFPAGEVSHAILKFSPQAWQEIYGIETITDFSFFIRYNDVFSSDICRITTSAAGTYTHTFTPEGTVVYDENGITVTVGDPVFNTALYNNTKDWFPTSRYMLPVYCTNRSGKKISVEPVQDWTSENSGSSPQFWHNGEEESADVYFSIGTDATYGMCESACDIADPLADDGEDIYKLIFTLDIKDRESWEVLATIPDITVEFSEADARAALASAES